MTTTPPAGPNPAATRPASPTTTCIRCGAHYVNDDEGRAAHRTVFSHQPRDTEEDVET